MSEAPDQPRTLLDSILRRPLLISAMLWICGILAHDHLPFAPWILCLAAFASALLALIFAQRDYLSSACLALALLLGGACAAQIQSQSFPANHIAHFTADHPRLATIECEITQVPRILKSSRFVSSRQVTHGRVSRILTRSGWVPATGEILIQLDQPIESLAIRQRIRAFGILDRPAPAMNPGQFDWAAYYRDQRILASFRVDQASSIRILADPGPSILDRLRISARDLLQRGFSEEHAIDHALLRALVLGDSDPALRDVQDDFLRTGTSHHLAISGMHIAILGGILYWIFRLLLLHPRPAVMIAMTCVILYGIVALPSPPVIRSVLLCAAFSLGLLSRQALDGIQLLSLSVLAMLIYQPLDLYRPGFQLSCGTVLGLMVFCTPAKLWIDSFRDRDMIIAMRVRRPPLLRRAYEFMRRWLIEILVAAIVAWIVSAPLIAWHFNQLNPYAIPAGIILAIPVLFGLTFGFLKIILTLLLPWLAPLWADMAALPMTIMRNMVDWLATIPGSDAALPRPPLTLLLFVYFLLFLPLLVRSGRLRRSTRFGAVLACLIIIVGPFISGRISIARDFRLTLLSVGAGQCAVVQLPSGRTLIIDAGSSSITDLHRRTIAPFLKNLGRTHIDDLFVSHANHDHFSAAPAILNECIAQRLFLSPLFRDHTATDPVARSVLSTSLSTTVLAAGDHLQIDADTTIDCLWPPLAPGPDTRNPIPDPRPISPNDSSLVLRLTHCGRTILFPGDIQDAAQRELLRNPATLKCDVLIAPHHGSSVTTTRDFLAAASPGFILASNDRILSSRQREFDRLCPVPLYRTHASGAITVTISSEGSLDVMTFRPTR